MPQPHRISAQGFVQAGDPVSCKGWGRGSLGCPHLAPPPSRTAAGAGHVASGQPPASTLRQRGGRTQVGCLCAVKYEAGLCQGSRMLWKGGPR
jgi:hypothetical protein